MIASPALLLAVTNPSIEPQPYFASIRRIIDALRHLGEPLSLDDEARIATLAQNENSESVEEAERVLSKYVLLHVRLNKDDVGQTSTGLAGKTLVEQGWRSCLVRVVNPIGPKI
jgi:hypothetical protein